MIDDNGFLDSISTEVGLLTKLFVLGLGRNTFEGSIPSELGFLTSLETLGLGEWN